MGGPVLKLYLVDIQSDADDGNIHHIGFYRAVDEDAGEFAGFIKNVVGPFDMKLFYRYQWD